MNRSSGSFELVGGALLLGAAGWFLDGFLGTRPIFMVALAVVGLAGATLSVFFRYRFDMDRATRARQQAAGHSS